MRDFAAQLKSALQERRTRVSWLLKITPIGLPVIRLNDIGVDFTYNAQTYLGSPGFVMGEAHFTDGADPPTLAVTIPVRASGPVTTEATILGLYNDAVVEIVLVDRDSLLGNVIGYKWLVGGTEMADDTTAKFEIRAATRVRRELILKTYGPGCKNDLGDARCGVDVLDDWTDTVTVVSVIDGHTIVMTGFRPSAEDDFYSNGAMKFTTGGNIDRAYAVRAFDKSTGVVHLWEPLRAIAQAGDTALIHAGCDKTTGDAGCARFDNFARRLAWDNLPADDAKYSYEEPAVSTTTEVSPSGMYSSGGGSGGFTLSGPTGESFF